MVDRLHASGSDNRRRGQSMTPRKKDVPPTEGKAIMITTASGVEAASGSQSVHFQRELLDQVTASLWLPDWKTNDQKLQAAKAAYEALQEIAPRSELEGMLAAQMIAAHNGAMECLRRAMMERQTFEGRDQNLKHATKLMGLYERQLAALDKHRGKGQQRITVEHVTVEAGGQAIVGEVHTGGKEQKTRGREEQGALPDDSAAEVLSREALKQANIAKTRNRKASQ